MIDDFGRLAANFNTAGDWARGDFDYSGTTSIDDFGLLAFHFNLALPVGGILPRGSVPEPTGAVVLAMLFQRRRRC